MNIYHLNTNPDKSAALLSDFHLTSLIHDCDGCLNIIIRKRKNRGERYASGPKAGKMIGYVGHPAVLSWFGFEWLLIAVRNAARNEAVRRGIGEDMPLVGQVGFKPHRPWWWGNVELIESHRALLWRKGEVGRVAGACVDYMGGTRKQTDRQALYAVAAILGIALHVRADIPESMANISTIRKIMISEGFSPGPNHYSAFGTFDRSARVLWPYKMMK